MIAAGDTIHISASDGGAIVHVMAAQGHVVVKLMMAAVSEPATADHQPPIGAPMREFREIQQGDVFLGSVIFVDGEEVVFKLQDPRPEWDAEILTVHTIKLPLKPNIGVE